MKLIFSAIIIILFASISSFACHWTTTSFCETASKRQSDRIFYGHPIISDSNTSDTNSIRFKIIEVIRGDETRDTITIWDGTSIECTGLYPMKAEYLKTNFDTIFLLIQKIEKIENSWDVINDYRRQDDLPDVSTLRVENGMIKGFIAGHSRPSKFTLKPQYKGLYSSSFTKFMAVWETSTNCTDILNGLSPENDISTFTFQNPITTNFRLNFNNKSFSTKSISIYNSSGAMIFSGHFESNTINIDMSSQPPGIYFVRIAAKDEKYQSLRIVKQ